MTKVAAEDRMPRAAKPSWAVVREHQDLLVRGHGIEQRAQAIDRISHALDVEATRQIAPKGEPRTSDRVWPRSQHCQTVILERVQAVAAQRRGLERFGEPLHPRSHA